MWERQGVLTAVGSLLARAKGGSAGTLFVVGEAGLGKTSILDRAREHAGDSGVRVGWAVADAMEASLPFGLLNHAFASLGQEVLLPPGHRRADHLYAALRWLQGLGQSPLLLALDDIHWGDPDSLELLSFLCRRSGGLPLAIVATLRPWPPEALDVVQGLGARWGAQVWNLRPLSETAACLLLQSRLGPDIERELCRRAWAACGGNPLLLEQVAAAMVEGREPDEAVGLPAAGLLLSRFADVPRLALQLARAASVLGARFRPDLAGELAELDEAAAGFALEALWGSGLLRSEGAGSFSFVHPLFQQVLYEDLGPPRQQRLHRRAYELLAERGQPAEAAEHARRAHPVGDPRALALLEAQGREALRSGAPAAATRYLESAAELAGAQTGVATLLALGAARAMVGQHTASAAAYEQALARPELSLRDRATALHEHGRVLFALASHSESEARYEQVVELCRVDEPELAVRALLEHALGTWLITGPGRSLRLLVRADEIARGTAPEMRLRVAAARGFMSYLGGEASGLDDGLAALRELGDELLADTTELSWGRGQLRTFATCAALAERFEESDATFARVGEAAEQAGSVAGVVTTDVGRLDALVQRGRLREALNVIERIEALVDLVPVTNAYMEMRLATILGHLDRWPESDECWERAMGAATAGGQQTARLCLFELRAHRWLREGRLREAAELYGQIEELEGQLGIGEPCLVRWARHAVLAYTGLGRLGDAARVTSRLAEQAEELHCRWPRIALAGARAAIAERRGRHQEAEHWHAVALELHDGLPLGLEHIQTLLEFGSFLGRHGRSEDAQEMLTEALQLAVAHGAVWLATLVHSELGSVARHGRAGRRPERLTRQELRVAMLAADGSSTREMSNALGLSVRTVETYLGRIYAKLGVHSQRELMRLERSWLKPPND